MNKIDMHCHTTNRRIEGVADKYPTLDVIENYMKQNEVEKTVLLATYFPHKGTGISNFRLLDWTRGKDNFFMFGSLDFDHFYFQGLNELEELAERKLMKGIKVYTCYQHIDLQSDKFKAVVNLAKEHNLPMMFHVGYSYSCMSKCGKVAYTQPVSPKSLEEVVKANPQVNFIFSHMGKPFFKELLEVVKANKNVYTDSSGLVDFDENPASIENVVGEVKQFVTECGADRLLFGTDFPVQTYAHSVYLIEKGMKDFSDSEKEKVFSGNARRLLRL
ncbi:MAG: amidohydrolase family protein [archaeon]